MKFTLSYLTLLFVLIKCMTDSATSWWWIIPFILFDSAVMYLRLARWAMYKQSEKLQGK